MKGFRTFALAFLTMLNGSLQASGVYPWPAEVTGVITAVLGAGIFALRTVTDTPPGKSV